MIYGMVQNKLQEDLVRSIGREQWSPREALPRDLEEPISRDEGLHTEDACMIHGMV